MLNVINLRSCFKRRSTRRSVRQVLTFARHNSLSSPIIRSLESILTKLAKLSNLTSKRFSSNIAQFKKNQFALSKRN
ncbi:MAG: hypothetical protein ACTS6G_05660 [Candidatus Hodgkinia cicadicola]